MRTYGWILCAALLTFTATATALPADYQSRDARAKRDLLWANVVASPYAVPPSLDGIAGPSLRQIFFSGIGGAFSSPTDEIVSTRTKIIHRRGSAALVRFEAAWPSPYTGIFKSGALGLVRASLALPFAPGKDFVPGLALKLFVDGRPSKNLTVMERLEGQGANTNYFEHPFTNVLPDPEQFATRFGTWAFERFVVDALHLSVAHVAEHTADGHAVAAPNAPFQIIFVPRYAIGATAADFRAELARIPAGTLLWTVYGRESAEADAPVGLIGRVISESPFVASAYEDDTLYFQHAGTALRSGFVF